MSETATDVGRGELGRFLASRRAALGPDDVGLVSYGVRRRVPGLRREELAQLAGVSVAYYTRLEQGQSRNASPEVLDALARALRLDETERAHLHVLARPAASRRPAPAAEQVTPQLRRLLDRMDGVPAVLLGRRDDILAWNRSGHALFAGHLDPDAPLRAATRPNLTRMLFLDPHSRELFADWDEQAYRTVAHLRLVAGRRPDDPRLAELVGELCMKADEFARLWHGQRVRNCVYGTKRFHHPLVGELTLDYQVTVLPDQSDQRLELLSAEPGSASEAALRLLDDIAAARDLTSPAAR